jgi:RNA polymerase sigma-70 factor (ECF subfamily)
MPTDEELLRSFAGGEREALGVLAGRHERGLLNLAMGMLGSREAAVDAVQETWVRVIRHAGKFNGRSGVKTWLFRIAINRCRSVLTKRKEPAEGLPEILADASNGPADDAEDGDESARLKRAVQRLKPPIRETILLCYTHGLTHAEAAEVMSVPKGTVKSRIHAGLTELRKQLGAKQDAAVLSER